MLHEIELAWAAGFFEGEGWVSRTYATLVDGTERHYLMIGVAQYYRTAELERFMDAVGVDNKIYGGPDYNIKINGKEAHRVMALLRDYFTKDCPKLQKYEEYCERPEMAA